VFVCVKNDIGSIGSANISIVKDTIAPSVFETSTTPSSVLTEDVTFGFKCSENGTYQVEIGGNGTQGSGSGVTVGPIAATANILNNVVVGNAYLPAGTGALWAYCKDGASNAS